VVILSGHRSLKNLQIVVYRKSSIKPPGGLFILSPFEGWGGGLIETGGLFNLETTMVSVIHKELEYKVEKFKYKTVGGHAD